VIVLFQRSLAPYRVPLFNCLSDALGGQFAVLLSRRDPAPGRRWTIPWPEVRFRVEVLPGHRVEAGRVALELSRGVRSALDALRPRAIVLGGWDVPACWSAWAWARRRGVPLISWVESAHGTGRHRGGLSSAVRREFLAACSAAIVPGAAAEQFVRELAPALPCHRAPNSVQGPDLRTIGPPRPAGAALFLGQLSRRKGADLVLAAAAELLSVFPGLIMAGDGPLRRETAALARQLPGLEYAGFVEGEDRRRIFERSAVVLLPSRMDPWPLVAAEALVGLRPVVLGPGVGSTADLRRAAGDAVVAMRAATPCELVAAARQARTRAVPASLRAAFSAEEVARAMASAIRSAGSARGAVR